MTTFFHDEPIRDVTEGQQHTVMINPIEEEGFTPLASGGSDPESDIVFIHGLQGHAEETWTHIERTKVKDQDASQATGTRRSIFGKTLNLLRLHHGTHNEEVRTFWPRDILHVDFPRARIYTYGYPSKISYFFGSGRPNHDNLTDNGRTFPNGLAARRLAAQGRPLMLITHSLGGLVVKSVGTVVWL